MAFKNSPQSLFKWKLHHYMASIDEESRPSCPLVKGKCISILNYFESCFLNHFNFAWHFNLKKSIIMKESNHRTCHFHCQFQNVCVSTLAEAHLKKKGFTKDQKTISAFELQIIHSSTTLTNLESSHLLTELNTKHKPNQHEPSLWTISAFGDSLI
jgi:hypothetical protein